MPLRGSVVNHQGVDLDSPIADHRNFLALEINAFMHGGSVQDRASKSLETRQLGDLPLTEIAGSIDKNVTDEMMNLPRISPTSRHEPLMASFHPAGCNGSVLEPAVLSQAMFGGEVTEVLLNLFTAGIHIFEVSSWFKRVCVVV